MKLKSTLLYLAAILMCCSFAFAQALISNTLQANVPKPDADKEIENALNVYLKALDRVFIDNRDQNIESVVQLLDKDYYSSRYIVDLGGYSKRQQIDRNTFRTELATLISINGLTVNHTIEKTNLIRAYETFAIASFSMIRSVMLGTDTLMKVRIFETLYFRKNDNKWLVSEENMANIYKEQTLGLCPCRIERTRENESKYAVSLLVPDGYGFANGNHNFEFIQANGGVRLIKVNDDAYRWDPKGTITCIRKNSTDIVSEQVYGPASNEQRAIETILVNYVYDTRCVGLSAMPQK